MSGEFEARLVSCQGIQARETHDGSVVDGVTHPPGHGCHRCTRTGPAKNAGPPTPRPPSLNLSTGERVAPFLPFLPFLPTASALALAGLALLAACRTSAPPEPTPPAPRPLQPRHDAIVVCGERFSIDASVVLWTDPGGYDAYSTALRFPDDPPAEPPHGLRYQPGRRVVKREGEEPALGALAGSRACMRELQSAIDLFVVHYDVCGVSRTCFKILHDRRKLSVHFMLDIDGTLYQTLDLADTAWHARQANPRSVGIEIANMGVAKPGAKSALDEWYAQDEHGTRIALPAAVGDGGVRTRGFVGRPARDERVRGAIHGVEYEQYDLTPQQYDTLVKLAAKLCELFPDLAPDAPRDAEGRVSADALSDDELARFHGILGHYHVTVDKQDPGPAFDWEAFLERVRERLAARAQGA